MRMHARRLEIYDGAVTVLAPKLLGAGLTALALLWPVPAESPLPAGHESPGRVRIEHELIRAAPAPRAAPHRANRPPKLSGATRLAALKPSPERPPANLAVRAARLLAGDGRYRPEPFPRVR